MGQGRIQNFKLGGAHIKKLRRAERGANIFGVFRVKNHDFTPKNHIFSNFRGGARRVRPCGKENCIDRSEIPPIIIDFDDESSDKES